MEFNTSLDFIEPYLSVKELVVVGVAVMAAVLVFLLSVMYAESLKKFLAKSVPCFGFKDDEAAAIANLAAGFIKVAGVATVLIMAGKYVPLLDPVKDAGSYIFELIGYGISLALPVAVIYLARTGFKR
ncbi:MAG: hypothetical protein WAX07_04885 [Candidatus Altiarchaeia archaeon]|jgi:hypothetical protein